jgi:GcrA cell cycle regulator
MELEHAALLESSAALEPASLTSTREDAGSPFFDARVKWPEEREDLLRKLFAEGMSFGMIAKELGLSRNAVIGKAHRMGLKGRKVSAYCLPQPPRERIVGCGTKGHRAVERIALPPLPEFTELVIPFSQRKTLNELEPIHCRWPVGDPSKPDFFFCGADKHGSFPYCSFHCARAFEPRRR